MRDFTKPSDNNGLIFESRAIRTLLEHDATAPEIEEIKPRVVDKEGIKYYREGDILDYVAGAENEFQGWEDA